MRCVTWPVGREPLTTKNLEILTPICLFTVQLSGATMMIKGSLLCSVPTVKRYRAKISNFISGPKIWGFGGLGGILTLIIRPPRKSLPTETRHLAQKRCRSMQKCGLQGRASNPIKIKITKIWPSHFTPLPGRPCGADFYHFWLVGSYRRCNHPCQILSRLVKGLGATATQNPGFPIIFECRSYNSVTH